jgi:YceI-like domain
VSIPPGTHRFGPDNAKLSLRTERAGAAAAAAHDLVIRVTSWEATLVGGDEQRMELSADPTSLRVVESTGGMKTLDDRDATSIHETIDQEVLEGRDITFRSTSVEVEGSRVHAVGELTLAGETRPIAVDLTLGDAGELSGSVLLKQTDWGMKPYSALFGTLKVKDEVLVVFEGHL